MTDDFPQVLPDRLTAAFMDSLGEEASAAMSGAQANANSAGDPFITVASLIPAVLVEWLRHDSPPWLRPIDVRRLQTALHEYPTDGVEEPAAFRSLMFAADGRGRGRDDRIGLPGLLLSAIDSSDYRARRVFADQGLTYEYVTAELRALIGDH